MLIEVAPGEESLVANTASEWAFTLLSVNELTCFRMWTLKFDVFINVELHPS